MTQPLINPGEWQVCPHCGDPLTTGCLPSAGICVVDPYENPNLRYAPGTSALTDEEWAAHAARLASGETT